MTTLYGIPNCDKVRAARKWLEQRGCHYHFHDLRAQPLSAELLNDWLQSLGPETLINRRSTTWRQLSKEEQTALMQGDAVPVIQAHPTVLKRPLLDSGTGKALGFDPARYESLL